MKVKIRITKEAGWLNGEKTYPKGQILNCAEADAATLVKDGIAEIYEAKTGDIIDVSPESGNLSAEQIKQIIADTVKENSKKLTKEEKALNTEEFAKKGEFGSFAEFAKQVKDAATDRSQPEKLTKWLEYVNSVKAPSGLSEA